MKKFPVLLWALIMAFSLVACGNSDGPENSIDQDQTPDTNGTEQPAQLLMCGTVKWKFPMK